MCSDNANSFANLRVAKNIIAKYVVRTTRFALAHDLYTFRRKGRTNSTKQLTKNDELRQSTDPAQEEEKLPEEPPADAFYYSYDRRNRGHDDDNGCDVSLGNSVPNTVRRKYFYKYAVSDGMGQVNAIDSSSLQLHPGDRTEGEWDEGSARLEFMDSNDVVLGDHDVTRSKQTTEADDNETGTPEEVSIAPNGRARIGREPRRVASRKGDKTLAWEVFKTQAY